MAEFDIALKRTLEFERGYVNKSTDHETYRGVNRDAWPDWEGWMHIDNLKADGKSIDIDDTFLAPLVAPFYLKNFWQPIRGNEIQSQDVANTLFDFAVNSGYGDAVEALQTVLVKLGVFLKVDGIIGRKTITAVNAHPFDIKLFRDERKAFIERRLSQGRIHHSLIDGLIRRAIKA
jgi:lysozyme family protein